MIGALWGYSMLVVLVCAWWPVTAWVYLNDALFDSWRDCYVTEVCRGAFAAVLGFVGAVFIAVFWPGLLPLFVIGHAVSRARKRHAQPVEVEADAP